MIDHSVQLNLSQAHEIAHLGALTKAHGMRRMKLSEKIAFGSLSGFFLGGVGFLIWIEFFLLPGPGVMGSFSLFDAAFFFGWPLLVLGIELSAIYFTLREHNILLTPLHRKVGVQLYTGGFLYREGRKRQVIAWEQVKFIQRQVAYVWGKPQRFYLVQLVDGSQIVLGLLIADIEELGKVIEQEITRRLLPAFLSDYEAGKSLVFPGLCITRQYISSSEERLPWIQVEQVEVSVERIIISERGASKPWLSLPLPQIPNLCVLLALLTHIGKYV